MISGAVRVIDGDSLPVGSTEVRLFGVDAFEGRQVCVREGNPLALRRSGRERVAHVDYRARHHVTPALRGFGSKSRAFRADERFEQDGVTGVLHEIDDRRTAVLQPRVVHAGLPKKSDRGEVAIDHRQ
jgi:hypothetical protein